MEEELKSQLGPEPTVCNFHEVLNRMTPEARSLCRKKMYGLALSGWSTLSLAYRRFLLRLIKSERQQFIDYIRQDTVLGELLYNLKDPDLFKKLLHLLECPTQKYKPSYTELSFSLLLGFSIPLKVKTLSDQIRYMYPDTDELLELYGNAKINNMDEM